MEIRKCTYLIYQITSKGGAFPCATCYQLEWTSGDFFTCSSHSNHHTDTPAFVAGLQCCSLQAKEKPKSQKSVHFAENICLPRSFLGEKVVSQSYLKKKKTGQQNDQTEYLILTAIF